MEADSGLFQYAYDPVGRITSVTHGKDVQSFVYDTLGNRIQSQQGGQTTHYAYNAANQLLRAQVGEDITEYGYDRRGNLVEVMENGALKQQFTFDPTNRMIRASTVGIGQARYTYDGLLNRVSKLESPTAKFDPTQEVRYILDRTLPYDNLLMTEGAQNQSFTWGKELISADDMLYLQDHLGSPIRLMGQFVVGIPQGYDAFGASITDTPSNRQPFGFAGYQTDKVSGMQFAQARYYMPEMGRFSAQDSHWNPGNMIYGDNLLQTPLGVKVPDPLAMAQSGNRYLHSMANPLRYLDRNGLQIDRDAIVDEVREATGLDFGPASGLDIALAYLRLIGICIALIPIPGTELKYKIVKAITNVVTSTTGQVLENGWEDFTEFISREIFLAIITAPLPDADLAETAFSTGVSTLLDNLFKWFRNLGSDAATAEWEAFQEMLKNKIA